MNAETEEQAKEHPQEEEEEHGSGECLVANRTLEEWSMFILGMGGAIVLLVFTGLDWNECKVISSLQYMVLFFGIVDFFDALLMFFKRTEKLRKEHGDCGHGWVLVEMTLGFVLLGMAIWGAVITFGSTDKVGSGPNQCAGGIFYCALVASAVTFAILLYEIGSVFFSDQKPSQSEQDKNAVKAEEGNNKEDDAVKVEEGKIASSEQSA